MTTDLASLAGRFNRLKTLRKMSAFCSNRMRLGVHFRKRQAANFVVRSRAAERHGLLAGMPDIGKKSIEIGNAAPEKAEVRRPQTI
jgi:hypothetical protein